MTIIPIAAICFLCGMLGGFLISHEEVRLNAQLYSLKELNKIMSTLIRKDWESIETWQARLIDAKRETENRIAELESEK